MTNQEQMQESLNSYRHALIAISDLADNQMPVHEQIFAGISYYTQLCFEMAPNTDLAQRTIDAGIEYGKKLSEENDDD